MDDDDSFDELSVPDDWLEQKSKRSAQKTSDSESEPTPPKRAKLSNEQFSAAQPSSSAPDHTYNNLNKEDSKSSSKSGTNFHLNYRLNVDKQGQPDGNFITSADQNGHVMQSCTGLGGAKWEAVSLNENEDPNSPAETLEDSSVNEPDTCEEMKVDDTLEDEFGSEMKFENNNDDIKQKNMNIGEAGEAIPKNLITKPDPKVQKNENNINNSSETLVVKNGSVSVTPESASATLLGTQTKPEQLEKQIHLHKSASIIRDADIVAGIVKNKDLNEIYDILLDHQDREDRLDFVTVQLLEANNSTPSPNVTTGDIFKDLQHVMSEVPSADANEVYAMLESLPPRKNRVKAVVTKLKKHAASGEVYTPHPPLPKKDSSFIDDPMLANDPLFRDMRTIAKMFPERDRNEIYAFLEAHYNKTDRLQVVINELINSENDMEQQTQDLGLPMSHPSLAGQGLSMKAEETFDQEVERMKMIFPDCDPDYLYEQLEAMKNEPKRTDIVAAKLFEDRNYPKLKDRLEKEKEKEKERKVQASKRDMTVPEFLQKFPDAKKTFMSLERQPSELYKEHAEICLKNEFPMLRVGYLRKTLAKHTGHLYPAYQEISEHVVHTPINGRRYHYDFVKQARLSKIPLPEKVDEYFYHELWFIHNELTVMDYPKQKELERKLKIEEAKLRGENYECCCCFDECLFDELASCPDGHLFCKTCVLRSTEAAFGEMKIRFPCLTGECDQNISLNTLQSIIPANLFSKIVCRIQEEEVQQANIPDLVTCPFCPFATIMPDLEDKLFKCLNPECLKESCRLCREPNHIPLRCNEVEKKAETDMRTYIENRISEAVMRKCHKCGKRFVKETGCNKMTCVCGANSCYACRAEDIDYNHFNNNKKCANTDPNAIHQRDMEEAADKAKAQYLLDHPEAKDIELKTDFKDMIKNVKPKKGRRNGRNVLFPRHLARYNYYDEDDEDDDEDGDIDDEDDVDIDGGGDDDDDEDDDNDDIDGDVDDDDDTDDDDIVNDVGDILKAILY